MSQTATNSEVDVLVKEKLIPLKQQLLAAMEEKHPHLFAAINALLANQQNKIGVEVTENGRVVGRYAVHMEGLRVTDVETGKLDSEVHHPFLGVIKPCVSVERRTIEQVIADEQHLRHEPFPFAAKYLPGLTIKFLP